MGELRVPMMSTKGTRVLTPRCQTSTGHETRDDRVPRVLLLSYALDGAVKRREHATPDAKVTARDWGTGLHGRNRTGEALPLQYVSTLRVMQDDSHAPEGSSSHP